MHVFARVSAASYAISCVSFVRSIDRLSSSLATSTQLDVYVKTAFDEKRISIDEDGAKQKKEKTEKKLVGVVVAVSILRPPSFLPRRRPALWLRCL